MLFKGHIMVLRTSLYDYNFRFTCHAVNSIGDSKGNIQVMGKLNLKPVVGRFFLQVDSLNCFLHLEDKNCILFCNIVIFLFYSYV